MFRELTDLHKNVIKLTTFPEFPTYPLEPTLCCIDVKLNAPTISLNEETGVPIDLVAVIDRSGSMNGEKLDLVKKVLHSTVGQLKTIDRLGIVTYDSDIDVTAQLTKVTQANRTALDIGIDKIFSGGSTNLSGGLLKGMKLMKERTGRMANVASVLLFTDGIANLGITDTNGIITAMNKMYGETKQFTVNTYGIGNDHNAELLRKISTAGNGLFHFIENARQIPEIFVSSVGGLLTTVGQDISVSIETFRGALVEQIICKRVKPILLTDGNKKGKVFIGDIQSEEKRDLLVKLSLPDITESISSSNSSNVYAKISLNYFNVIKNCMKTDNTEVRIPRSRRDAHEDLTSSVQVEEQKNRINLVDSLARAAELAEKGRVDDAREILTSCQQTINTSFSCNTDMITSLTEDLKTALRGVSDKQAFHDYGKSIFATLEDSHSSQRSTSLRSLSYTTRSRSESYHGYLNAQEEFNARTEPGNSELKNK